MRCPNCLTLMKCISEIHNVPGQPGRQRMDLHCVKPIPIKDPSTNKVYEGRGCELTCHMGVITEDPKEWVCHEYNFEFRYEGKRYYLRGYDYLVDPYHQTFGRPYERATIFSMSGGSQIMKIDFIPISTGDDMHERAWDLFHRLKKLIAFS